MRNTTVLMDARSALNLLAEQMGDNPNKQVTACYAAIDAAIKALEKVESISSTPYAEIWWDSSNDCDWQLKMLVEPSCMPGERIPLFAGEYATAPVMYVSV